MPYVNRYFHKRDYVAPLRRSYQMKPSLNEGVINQRLLPRYVTSYEYATPPSNQVELFHTPSLQRFTTEVTTNKENKTKYRQNHYETKPSDAGQTMILKRHDEGVGPTLNLKAKVKAPSGSVQFCDIIDFDNHHFNIQFTPRETGEHRVSVKSGNLHVPGSPFKFYVENVEETGIKNIQVFGMGLHTGFTNEKNEFSIYARDGGSGNLTVSIDGPSKALIEIREVDEGTYSVAYNISRKGNYLCSVKFNGENIPGSPFKMAIEEPIEDFSSKNVALASVPNQGLVAGHSSNFTIRHGSLSSGLMRAYVVSPSRKEENVKINHLGEDNFNVQFEPKETGVHQIHVLLDERPIAGSPFQLMVGEVIAHGNGLINGKLGEENSFKLDTKFVEPGPLTVTIDGPSKVELECFETDQGYEFVYVPTVPGEYVIVVKYGNNIHTKGSPFKVNVTGESQIIQKSHKNKQLESVSQDLKSFPEQVKCRGDGLSKAYIGRNNQFIVDASSGGAGVLYVGIAGSSKPSEEVNVRHIGGKRFQVNYFLQEFGEHIITVRWGDRDIPGSPFIVYVQ